MNGYKLLLLIEQFMKLQVRFGFLIMNEVCKPGWLWLTVVRFSRRILEREITHGQGNERVKERMKE